MRMFYGRRDILMSQKEEKFVKNFDQTKGRSLYHTVGDPHI